MEIIEIDIDKTKYPQRLLQIKSFPTKIYAVGNIELLNAKYTVAIVGSRKCTEYGRRVASEFSKKLSEKGICVVSGMAAGIDGIAHNAAIDECGKTIAVLGGGFNHIYPPENEWLFHKIVEKGGCVISEYSSEIEADKSKFPIRNRIISGLSDAVLVVEALFKSGSTITARLAKQEGKRVYAIPNNIYASTAGGTNRLIQEGAFLVTEPMQIINDIIDIEKIKNTRKKIQRKKKKNNENNENNESNKNNIDNKENIKESNEKQHTININENISKIMPIEYLDIYKILSDVPIHINEISKKLEKPVYEISSVVTMMEIDGYAYQPQTNYFMKNLGDIKNMENLVKLGDRF